MGFGVWGFEVHDVGLADDLYGGGTIGLDEETCSHSLQIIVMLINYSRTMAGKSSMEGQVS